MLNRYAIKNSKINKVLKLIDVNLLIPISISTLRLDSEAI